MQLLNATRAQTRLWASVSNYSSHSDINTRTFSRAVHTLNCLLSSFFTRADWWVLLPPGYRCPLYIVHCTDIWTKTRQCNSFSPSLTNVNLNPTRVSEGPSKNTSPCFLPPQPLWTVVQSADPMNHTFLETS